MAKTTFRFSIFGLSHRLYRGGGSEVTVGSEDQLQFFLKGIFVQEGSSGTCFDHGQFEIKTFPIYAPPYCQYQSFSDWNFTICKGWQIKTVITYTWPSIFASVYKLIDSNTGIAIFMPTSKCLLAVAGFLFFPAFDHLFSVIKWSLVMCRIR